LHAALQALDRGRVVGLCSGTAFDLADRHEIGDEQSDIRFELVAERGLLRHHLGDRLIDALASHALGILRIIHLRGQLGIDAFGRRGDLVGLGDERAVALEQPLDVRPAAGQR
jgi:hypothetical protein